MTVIETFERGVDLCRAGWLMSQPKKAYHQPLVPPFKGAVHALPSFLMPRTVQLAPSKSTQNQEDSHKGYYKIPFREPYVSNSFDP